MSEESEQEECQHEWIIEHHNNGVGHHWVEVECAHCDADITDDEYEALVSYYEGDY